METRCAGDSELQGLDLLEAMQMKLRVLFAIPIGLSLAGLAAAAGYSQQNLVSDGAVPAAHLDPDLKNPWGISFGSSTPFWVSDNGTGLATLYDASGAKQPLIVTVPPPLGSPVGTKSTPTGTVFNASSGFMGDSFLFATEQGTIAGWQSGTTGSIRVNNTGGSAVYKGLALSGSRIYASNFGNGRVDVFDNTYSPVALGPGAFVDSSLPAGFAPFNVQEIGGAIYVTYAKQGPTGDDVSGPGNGFVDKYDANGALIQRLIIGEPGDAASPLNSPWGIAVAPPSFGELSGLLLVGNFGDGKINAFNPTTGAFVKTLTDAKGNPVVIDGLWALAFGNTGPGFDPNKLYFTAGPNDEADGLFGSLGVIPEPGTVILLGAGLVMLCMARRHHSLRCQAS